MTAAGIKRGWGDKTRIQKDGEGIKRGWGDKTRMQGLNVHDGIKPVGGSKLRRFQSPCAIFTIHVTMKDRVGRLRRRKLGPPSHRDHK